MNGRTRVLILALVFAVYGTSCSPAKDSTEENMTPPRPVAPIDQSGDNNFKYAQTVVSENGWTVTYDSADAVEEVVLPDGWHVEVKYE
ncbi:hypothetical protein [Pseudobdellovibrio exovorus]|uniref:Uncharacterized protein n=1 Tax=Pseudobdellovibrio exovorus JSS TaxID=1184267 RepID=M4VC14_9BACT|nr:hypothetical protein [Pseudobdellovibrio exovorus]AGH96005.1 hypothetical protein A11Q_1789 [Pseudobdellovibrio exovorus JSS]